MKNISLVPDGAPPARSKAAGGRSKPPRRPSAAFTGSSTSWSWSAPLPTADLYDNSHPVWEAAGAADETSARRRGRRERAGSIVQTLLDQKGTAAARAAAEGEREAAAGRLKRKNSLHQANGLLDNPVFEPRGPKAEQHGLTAIGGFLAATMAGRRAASSSSSSSAARRAAARRRSSAR